jgi:hypothetical protein
VRALLVFQISSIKPLVKHSDKVMATLDRIFTKPVIDWLLRVGSSNSRHVVCMALRFAQRFVFHVPGNVLWPLLCGCVAQRCPASLNPFARNCETCNVSGEDGVSIQPTVQKLKSAHIGSILDYAAEADVGDERRQDIHVPFHALFCARSRVHLPFLRFRSIGTSCTHVHMITPANWSATRTRKSR